jgi:O-methyltransferase
MKVKLFFIRKTKAIFLKLKLHKLFGLMNGFMFNLSYLNEFSRWRASITKPELDDFFNPNFGTGRRFELFDFIKNKYGLNCPIDYLEFGVAYGRTFKWWAENNTNAESKFYGFDTFEGLPEDWNLFKKGDMSAGGKLPDMDDNRAEFLVGLFQDTLPGFLRTFKNDKRKVIHIDADLYTSTLFVLTSMAHLLRKDDIIIFDEFGVPMHEFKAYMEFTKAFRIETEIIAAVNNYFQVAFIVK